MDAYEQVVSHIRKAVEAGLTVCLAVTPSSYMSPWTERVMKLAGSFGVSVMVNDSLIDPHDNTGRKKADFDIPLEEDMSINGGTAPYCRTRDYIAAPDVQALPSTGMELYYPVFPSPAMWCVPIRYATDSVRHGTR